MDTDMSYLLGMICGNGEIRRGDSDTTISIEIPHKKLRTENNNDVKVYVSASINNIRSVIEPLIGASLHFIQQDNYSMISFRKPNDDYLIREILRYTGRAASHEYIRIDKDVFLFTWDEKIAFLQGFADVTGYIRRSNYFRTPYMHRVYLEVPHNWYLVTDICRLLRAVDVPVQTIDWAHPNMRDGKLKKYREGKPNFWKKEHQIKIFANEFLPIGFAVIHKREALMEFASELINGLHNEEKDVAKTTHRYYWEGVNKRAPKPVHPGENDASLPIAIRGKHYDSWKDIASDLGYIGNGHERLGADADVGV